jgi:molybdopterin-guanine dinucleotide biosynthesis protein MobB
LPNSPRAGLRVSTIKHAHHAFDIDIPGKDSHRHRTAGAHEVLVASRARWAIMHALRSTPEPSFKDLLQRLAPCDLILVEGFKKDREVHLHDVRRSARALGLRQINATRAGLMRVK